MKYFFSQPVWERFRLTDDEIRLLTRYAETLLKWNTRVNLTGARSRKDLLPHFYLSLCFREHLRSAPCTRVLDLGSGAGFPGIPLKICCQDLRMDLVDSRSKRVSFLKTVTRQLGLSGLHSHACRWEDLPSLIGSEARYDCIISRGADRLANIIGSTQDLLAEAGRWVILKGKRRTGEIEELCNRYHGSLEIQSFELPFQGDWCRDYVFVIIEECFT